MAASRSASGSATTEFRQLELPAISLTGPAAVTPAPSAQARLSAAPAITGTAFLPAARAPEVPTSTATSTSPRCWRAAPAADAGDLATGDLNLTTEVRATGSY